jgi:hypothetical protein
MPVSRVQAASILRPRTKYLPYHVTARIAVSADADQRTVLRFCQGHDVKGRVAERIEKALNAAGISVIDEHGDAVIAHEVP